MSKLLISLFILSTVAAKVSVTLFKKDAEAIYLFANGASKCVLSKTDFDAAINNKPAYLITGEEFVKIFFPDQRVVDIPRIDFPADKYPDRRVNAEEAQQTDQKSAVAGISPCTIQETASALVLRVPYKPAGHSKFGSKPSEFRRLTI